MQSVTLAVDWITFGSSLGTDFKTLIFKVLIPAMAGLFIVVIGVKTRAPGPTIMAVIFGGIMIGLSLSIDTIGASTSDTINEYNDGGNAVIQGDQ